MMWLDEKIWNEMWKKKGVSYGTEVDRRKVEAIVCKIGRETVNIVVNVFRFSYED